MSVRRNLMNVVRNYTDAEIKVREATSNDPWGPSSSLMSEIADLTYNVVAFSEIMTMVWKRINDHGKNWRHVYKALTLLDYLIKTGTERVATQCKENIFAIQTLKDFQFIDRDGKDQGLNVREKSKQLVNLLKDDERLKKERTRALKAKERFAQSRTGISSDNKVTYGHGSATPQTTHHRTTEEQAPDNSLSPEIEQARPTSAGEEELQLQLALAMSKEEADQQEKVSEGDSLRLKMAIQTSEKEDAPPKKKEDTSLFDLSSAAAQLSDPWANKNNPNSSVPVNPATDNFGLNSSSGASDPWGENTTTTTTTTSNPSMNNDPWDIVAPQPQQPALTSLHDDPWGAPTPAINSNASSAWPNTSNTTQQPASDLAAFDLLGSTNTQPQTTSTTFDFNGMNSAVPTINGNGNVKKEGNIKSFLGSGADLVNLDNLIKPQSTPQVNPFAGSAQPSVPMGGVTNVPVQQQTQIYPQFGNPSPQPMYNNPQQNFMAPQMAPTAFGQTQHPMMQQQPAMIQQPMFPASGYPANNMNNSSAQNNPFLL